MLKKTLMVAAGLALGVSTPAMAVQFIGTTQGCFGAGCSPGGGALLGGLTFTGGSFDVTDNNGFVAIGGVVSDNLGSFTLDDTDFDYNGEEFTLRVLFSAPAGTAPGSADFEAILTGSVGNGDDGGVFVDFDNSSRNFTFPGGTFDLGVNNLSVTPDRINYISGQINVDTGVPEPATWAMLLVGFGGIGFAMRRRKSDGSTQRVRVAYS